MPGLTLFLDESGGRPWPSPWGHNRDKFYVLAGRLLDARQIARAQLRIPQLLEGAFPEEPRPRELHYGDLINSRDEYSRLGERDRLRLSNAVFQFIEDLNPLLMGTVIRKVPMKEDHGEDAIPPHHYAMQATLGRFDAHLRGKQVEGGGAVEMDSAGFQHDFGIQGVVDRIRLVGSRFGRRSSPRWLDSRLDAISSFKFVRSHDCAGVQIADFVAYATWSHFERGKSRRFLQTDRLWRRYKTLIEPSILPKGLPRLPRSSG